MLLVAAPVPARSFTSFSDNHMVAPLSRKDFLKRYGSEDDEKKKKKRKKKEKVKPSFMGGILVVDEDPVWQKPVQIEQEGSESETALSSDLSPPRRTRPQSPEAIRSRNSSPGDLSPPRKTRKVLVEKEPRRGGLLSAKELREENDRTRKEALSRFASLDPSLSGKSAEPVYRDAKGKAISKEELLKPKEEEKPKEKKLEWGKGLAQKRQAEANTRDLEIEKDKLFARTKDDPDLDKMLKERVRWGDPMAHLVQKNSETTLEDLGENKAMKESGFIIPQTIPAHSCLKRGVDCLPNRYGIKPGRHWDGVDRSNGFEKDIYKRQNEKRATEREAYLWSVSDM
ncbi:BUD13 homolog isoform X2 [Zingiber officinale]|uniref:Pre-mRNA-splicing factor CWC26 n=1 Tax=Zingiber officinale TaxID=94328 RepID=A0A8J5GY71_ZINOF|nr:BUD13 homolog isoform X2 [Zingiber officinale]KAG6512311.1 hypothetical protein ZIOFF_030411 [Zingiber officinale]